jgi:hypothetical protein
VYVRSAKREAGMVVETKRDGETEHALVPGARGRDIGDEHRDDGALDFVGASRALSRARRV